MKREISFKAKSKKGKWIEGLPTYDFVYLFNYMNFDSVDNYEIDEKTLCQFINKKDKAGKKIFEGDYDVDGNCVLWCDECNGFEFGQLDIPTKEIVITCHRCDGNFFFGDHIGDFESIGNIFD